MDADMCRLRCHCHMTSRGLTTRRKGHREQTLERQHRMVQVV